jgi:hypothetical protein
MAINLEYSSSRSEDQCDPNQIQLLNMVAFDSIDRTHLSLEKVFFLLQQFIALHEPLHV